MKKEWIEKDHCPYCKRHCSLQDPHCRKGKTLVEELKKEGKKKESPQEIKPSSPVFDIPAFTESEKEELKQVRTDLSLFLLYLKGSEFLLKKADGKSSGKKIRYYILNLLAEKGEVTPKELKDCSNLDTAALKKALARLEEKGEILIQQTESQGRSISLTEKGGKAARQLIGEGTKADESLFSVLNGEEKKSLELILSKLMV